MPTRRRKLPYVTHALCLSLPSICCGVRAIGRNHNSLLWHHARGWSKAGCISITFILILVVLQFLLPLLDNSAEGRFPSSANTGYVSGPVCMDSCRINLVESIPIGLVYSNDSVSHPSTYHTWMELIASAQSSIEIASRFWTLREQPVYFHDSAKQGEDVFQALLEAGRDRGIRLRFAQDILAPVKRNKDTEYLSRKANAEVRSFNFTSSLGSGIFHTKLWLIDRTHFYIGSANTHWCSLTQMKELGLVGMNCSCLASDLAKIFDVYWKLSEDGKAPATWPESLTTKINLEDPMNFTLDGNKYRSFFASSPPRLSPRGRTNELDAVLHCIDKAKKFIYIAVPKYFPLTIFTPKIKYWPAMDDALRSAAIDHNVHVRMLITWSQRFLLPMRYFLKSLSALTESYNHVKIEVKLFVVPTSAEFKKLPKTRLNHHKYLVTDIAAYIGTSNFIGDYFTSTSGIGVVLEDVGHKNEENIRQQLEEIFLRDWNSRYAHPLDEFHFGRDMA